MTDKAASFAPDDEWLMDQMLRDIDTLSKENKRLNQIVDAFCILAGVEASELPTVKEMIAELMRAPLRVCVPPPEKPQLDADPADGNKIAGSG